MSILMDLPRAKWQYYYALFIIWHYHLQCLSENTKIYHQSLLRGRLLNIIFNCYVTQTHTWPFKIAIEIRECYLSTEISSNSKRDKWFWRNLVSALLSRMHIKHYLWMFSIRTVLFWCQFFTLCLFSFLSSICIIKCGANGLFLSLSWWRWHCCCKLQFFFVIFIFSVSHSYSSPMFYTPTDELAFCHI